MLSLTIIQPAFSSVNCGLKEKPKFWKKAIDFTRFFTGRLINTLVGIRLIISAKKHSPAQNQSVKNLDSKVNLITCDVREKLMEIVQLVF